MKRERKAREEFSYNQVKGKKFLGITVAYERFLTSIQRIEELLELGSKGILEEVDKAKEIINIFNKEKGISGPVPKDYVPSITRIKNENDRTLFSIDARTANILKRVATSAIEGKKVLQSYLWSLLVTSSWGTFETYIYMLFEELYDRQPNLLVSQESITIQEILKNQDNIVEHLIERQLDKIGHFNLQEVLKYMHSRINFEFNDYTKKNLSDYYLARNIIAHNTGLVRKKYEEQLLSKLKIFDGELRITKSFLQGMLKNIKKSVKEIEKHIMKKFYKGKRR